MGQPEKNETKNEEMKKPINPYLIKDEDFNCPLQSEYKKEMSEEEFNSYYNDSCMKCPVNTSKDAKNLGINMSDLDWLTSEIMNAVGENKITLIASLTSDSEAFKKNVLQAWDSQEKFTRIMSKITPREYCEALAGSKNEDHNHFRRGLELIASSKTKPEEVNIDTLTHRDLRNFSQLQIRDINEMTSVLTSMVKSKIAKKKQKEE